MKFFGLLLLSSIASTQPLCAEEPVRRPVISEIVESELARLPSFPGVIAAEVESVLAFQTTGRLATRIVDLGDRVAEGDVLATLDQISLAEDVSAASAALDAARAQAALAKQNLDRAEQLFRQGITPEAQLEAMISTHDSTSAAVVAAEADLARAESAERYGVLRAPSDGVVVEVSTEPGTAVAPGTPVLTLALDGSLDVVISVSPEVLPIIPSDAEFLIRPRGAGAEPVTGRLRLIRPIADTATRSRQVLIRLEGTSPRLRIGSLVEVEPALSEAPILTVPMTALREIEGAFQVWRITAEGRQAEAVPVDIGPQIGDRIVIAQGLWPGDEILVRGANSITAGQVLGDRTD